MSVEMLAGTDAAGGPSTGCVSGAAVEPGAKRPRLTLVTAPKANGSGRRFGAATAARRDAVRGLLRDYHERGDLEARNRLIQEFLPLVRKLARRYAGLGEQPEDLVQVGAIGLIKAIDRFQLDRGVELAAFAIPTIDGEIKRHLRDRAWPVRIPRRLQERDPSFRARATELLDPSDGIAEHDGALDRGYELGEDRAALAQGFRVLDDRERRLLGLGFFEDLPQTQIARQVGISQIHVSRLTRRALAKLRAEIGGD
jgi:RNA polymerase sigma-B factor